MLVVDVICFVYLLISFLFMTFIAWSVQCIYYIETHFIVFEMYKLLKYICHLYAMYVTQWNFMIYYYY